MSRTPSRDIASFQEVLSSSTRILSLLGAGLSASSGLPTFRGAGGFWRNHDATVLATPEAFQRDPGLVWQFYAYRRHMALNARPNAAHYALAELARKKKGFLTLSQNVDGLSPRANHPPSQIHFLHGSLMDIKCSSPTCDYYDKNNLTDPLCPILTITPNFSDAGPPSVIPPSLRPPTISPADLPHCPKCQTALLRPGVVWFGEQLPGDVLDEVDAWIEDSKHIDLMLVIGTSVVVWPAASYIAKARAKGAKVAVVNLDAAEIGMMGMLRARDWLFEGDAATILPEIFKGVIGEDYPTGQGSTGA